MKLPDGIKRLIPAMLYSFKGLKATFIHEAAFRQELLLAAVLIPLACLLDVSAGNRLLMIAVLILLLIVELLNTAVEAVVDRIGSEQHELSGRAKDAGSAAVFLTLILAFYIWGAALWVLVRG